MPGDLWPAWNLLLWQVPQLVMPEPTALACSLFEWHAEQVLALLTLVECCALAAGPVPEPLWQVAHALWATFLPACLMGWQDRQFLWVVVLDCPWWKAAMPVWQVRHATLPACCW